VRVLSEEKILVSEESHIVLARHRAGHWAKELGMRILDQTKIATAASELARNIVRYGVKGWVLIQVVEKDGRSGLCLTFQDEGPGIADIPKAMQDGYTTGKGMGLGLAGSKRLVNEFEIFSNPGGGTKVIIKKWKQT
jgi:serine/threonine-protein kinase RsbT